MTESIDHPAHYGGAEDKFEVIKVLRAWDLDLAKGFCWGNVIKYTARADKKGGVEDREKATWYADELVSIEKELAERKEAAGPTPETVVVTGNPDAQIVIDWDNRTYDIQHDAGTVSVSTGPLSGAGGAGGGGGGGKPWQPWEEQRWRFDTGPLSGVPYGSGQKYVGSIPLTGSGSAMGGSNATVYRCNRSWGCTGGYHGRNCPLYEKRIDNG